MFEAKLKIKIWAYTNGVDCGQDWFVDRESLGTFEQALAEPFRVAAVPVMFDRSRDFTYLPGNENIDLSQFDLVLLSDIEYRPVEEVAGWAYQKGIKKWVLATSGYDLAKPFDYSRCVYRPWWIYNRDVKFNHYQEVRDNEKPFVCDVLLGSRRPNRDFVMLAMQKHGLLDKNLVTYRHVFTGDQVNDVSVKVFNHFDNMELQWPYVSPNLDPAWEVSDNINHSISQTVPWEIYRRTWVSIAVESVSRGSMFFMAEKISKPMMAMRPFIVFGIKGFLRKLKVEGFKTFEPYIDESYDDIDDDIRRWEMAFEQVQRLHQMDLARLYTDLEDRLIHNFRYIKVQDQCANHNIIKLLREYIDQQYWSN